ncbi:MAG: oligosaccharide flippase family protein [Chloroflexota bacterium]
MRSLPRHLRRLLPEIAVTGLLFLLPLILFWGQTIGGRTLLPTENLYQFAPYSAYREVVQAPDVPHNHLLDDLVLQNLQWKTFIRQNIDAGEIPLWNPHQFAGQPFMAAGQQSTLYPLSVLYYALPLPAAYGWFTVAALWLAGLLMTAFVRAIAPGPVGARRFGGVVGGVTYQLCGFLVASAVHPMIIGAAAWLPLLLLMAEYIIRQQPILKRPAVPLWVVIGAAGLAFNIFAGHPEMTIYSLLITAFYAAGRLGWRWWQARAAGIRPALVSGGWLAAMIALGFVLGAVQFIPLFEVASDNWRTERGSLESVLSFAHAPRDVIQYIMPNFFGSPAQHSYFDWFALETRPVTVNLYGEPITHTEWGIKNYVEGALYVGILPLALALFALIAPHPASAGPRASTRMQTWLFAALTVIAATFMFGLPTYAVVYVLPGINQLNTAFRWVYGVTVGLAVLGGIGAALLVSAEGQARRWARRLGLGMLAAGALVLVGLLLSRLVYPQIESVIADALPRLAGQGGETAANRFSGPAMFYSVQFTNALIFGVVTLLSGLAILALTRRPDGTAGAEADTDHARPHSRFTFAVQVGALVLLAADLMIASWGFNPAADPALLDFVPPTVEWLQEREAAGEVFRYTTLEDPARGLDNMLKANVTMRHDLDDIRGYESIISGGTVAYMRAVQTQPQLDFNRVAPLYLDRVEAGAVDWERLNLLNVRYIVTHPAVTLPEDLTTSADPRRFAPRLELVFETPAAKIYRNNQAFPRVFYTETDDGQPPGFEPSNIGATNAFELDYTEVTSRERTVGIDLSGVVPQWLVLSESYAPGWRAFVRPTGLNANGDPADERELPLHRAYDNLLAVELAPDSLAGLWGLDDLSDDQALAVADGRYVVRFIYSPTSFQVGAFGSAIGAALALFLGGVWLWGVLVGRAGEGSGDASVVARNSIAPIVLNLFNRGIDFAFAFVMLRILGPEDAGIYYYAIVVFVWFDIFTNFGLDVFLIREASREKARAGFFLANTSALRLLLFFACIPLLLGFLALRQATVDPQLNAEALLAIGLLYIGLAPASISKGLTSIFYAFQRAEYPAAVTTITTMNKAVFGLIVLLLGYGIVGLAAVSIGVNVITLGILTWAALRVIRTGRQPTPTETADRAEPVPALRPSGRLMRGMVGESWPLMLNHFLATIFFQIDIIILEALRGARIVGQYSVAYRWLLAINIVPAFFTQALLPVMSRQAREDRAALARTYTLGVKLLVLLAVPLAVTFTFLAEALTLLLGGEAFMPAGAVALQIMIWSIPVGWMNSLTQYALIAVDLQRRITWAFAGAVSFNIITNLIFIPQFGYQAAAVTTIFSEIVLLLPFGVLMQRALGRLDWLDMVWRPAVAGGVMFGVTALLWPPLSVGALLIGGVIYAGLLLALRPLSTRERAMLAPVLPGRRGQPEAQPTV